MARGLIMSPEALQALCLGPDALDSNGLPLWQGAGLNPDGTKVWIGPLDNSRACRHEHGGASVPQQVGRLPGGPLDQLNERGPSAGCYATVWCERTLAMGHMAQAQTCEQLRRPGAGVARQRCKPMSSGQAWCGHWPPG